MYGLGTAWLRDVETGYRNQSHAMQLGDARTLNLILYKREAGMAQRIQNANRVANSAAGQGLPARRTADQRIVRLRSGAHVQYGALYHYLPGATIPWEAYTMAHLKLLGAGLSDLHAALARLERGELPAAVAEYLAITGRMQRYFSNAGVRDALRRKLRLTCAPLDFTILLRACAQLPGQQPLHMDFVRGNILFQSAPELHISGILDFEKTAWGHPVFDIARTLAFLLVDCKYKPADKIRKYFLQSGYHKRGAASFADVQLGGQSLLDQLIHMFLLYDFYKFLRHNPYEHLRENEHFLRTERLLLQQNMVCKSGMLE